MVHDSKSKVAVLGGVEGGSAAKTAAVAVTRCCTLCWEDSTHRCWQSRRLTPRNRRLTQLSWQPQRLKRATGMPGTMVTVPTVSVADQQEGLSFQNNIWFDWVCGTGTWTALACFINTPQISELRTQAIATAVEQAFVCIRTVSRSTSSNELL